MSIRSNIPSCPTTPVASASNNAYVFDIELITPLFGGGVSTRVNDPSLPIRTTAIRGQLQFWWRATVGAQYATRQELRAAQSAIWGDTTRASRVQVRIDSVQATEPEPCARYEMDRNRPGTFRSIPTWNTPFNNTVLPYALFPFQGQLANGRRQVEVEPASCIRNATFRLTVICHDDIDYARQVEPAIWAWANFGGLGSRTRRGCGAIFCNTLAPRDKDDLKAMWLRHMPALFRPREWPTMAESVSVRTVEQPAGGIPVWDWLIGRFRHFRQGEGLGRNPRQQGSNRPGRSHYSEPETIRRVAGRRIARHTRLPRIPDDAFPRAELGLPIVFHFQDEQNGEPPDTVLYPDNDSEGKRRERMASPLILKPLALQNGKAIPLIVRLRTPALMGVDLRIKKKDLSSLRDALSNQVKSTMRPNDNEGSLPLPPTSAIRDPRLSTYPNSPLAGSPSGSAIEAFLDFARSEGFTEVAQ
jgi:CRISPR-associated protein Cmr1